MFIEKLKWKLIGFMQGRYGQDKLGKHIYILAIVFLVLSLATRALVFTLLCWALLLASTIRMMSKNTQKRYQELLAYERLLERPRLWWKLQCSRWRDRKTHKYFRCSCGTTLRVPKGKGRISVRCPNCQSQQIHKT